MLHLASVDVLEAEPISSTEQSQESLSGNGWHWWMVRGVKTIAFAGCWVHIDEASLYLHTSYADGRSLWSVPVYEKDILTARAYGYGEDAQSLWREHDVLHHRVALCFGHDSSPTIWSECHEDDPRALPPWARREEEVFLAHVHRWLNRDEWHNDLWAFHHHGHDLQAVYDDCKRLLASLHP